MVVLSLILSAMSGRLAAAHAQSAAECKIAEEAIRSASAIRQLTIRRTVPCFLHDRERVKRYLEDSIDEQLPPEKLRFEEGIYKTLGFIPEAYDFKKGIIDLYLSQIGGYYDPKLDHYVMASWLPAILQPTIAVHELTHALQDQYYDLDKLIRSEQTNGDLQLSRSALAEGDATAVMIDYNRKLAGQPPLASENDVNSMMLQSVVSMSLLGGAAQVPASLQLMLIFPYTSGLRFAHHLLQHGGYRAIDEAFKRPPQSTAEILHPEKYLAQTVERREVSMSDLLERSGRAEIYRDTVGEFAISVLLGTATSNKSAASEISSAWAGDLLILARAESASPDTLIWRSEWRDHEAAERFAAALRQQFRERKYRILSAVGDLEKSAEEARTAVVVVDGMRVTLQAPLLQ